MVVDCEILNEFSHLVASSITALQSLALNTERRKRRKTKRLFSQYSQSFNKRSNVIHRCNNPDLLKGSSMQLLSIIGLRINRDRAEDPLSNMGTGGGVQPTQMTTSTVARLINIISNLDHSESISTYLLFIKCP